MKKVNYMNIERCGKRFIIEAENTFYYFKDLESAIEFKVINTIKKLKEDEGV
jgi:hypothetical protein